MVIYSSKMAMHSGSYKEQVQYCKNKTGRDKEKKRKQILLSLQTAFYSTMKKYLALNAVSMDNSIKQHQHGNFKFFCIFSFCHLGGGLLTNIQQRQFKHKQFNLFKIMKKKS